VNVQQLKLQHRFRLYLQADTLGVVLPMLARLHAARCTGKAMGHAVTG